MEIMFDDLDELVGSLQELEKAAQKTAKNFK